MMHDSPLVQHARDELHRLGETDRRFVASIVSAIGEFAAYRHSGGSAAIATEYVTRLLRFEHLAPLTGDPAEWIDRSDISGRPLWQSKRNPRAFSTDAGDTWYFVDPQHVGERGQDGGEWGVLVACACCGGSGRLFKPDYDPDRHGDGPDAADVPPRALARPDDDEDEPPAGGDGDDGSVPAAG